MILATPLHIEKIRKEVSAWHLHNELPGYNFVMTVTEWELNRNGFTMHESKVT